MLSEPSLLSIKHSKDRSPAGPEKFLAPQTIVARKDMLPGAILPPQCHSATNKGTSNAVKSPLMPDPDRNESSRDPALGGPMRRRYPAAGGTCGRAAPVERKYLKA